MMRVFTPKDARARSESARERRLLRDEDLGAEKVPPGEGEAVLRRRGEAEDRADDRLRPE